MKNLIKEVAIIGIYGGVFAFVISVLKLIKKFADGLQVTLKDLIYIFLDGLWGIIFCGLAYLVVQYWEPSNDPEKVKVVELLCCGFFAGANSSIRLLIYKTWNNFINNPKKFITEVKEVIKK